MSRAGGTPPPPTRTSGRRVAVLAIVALVILVAGAGYFAFGQWRAEAGCGREVGAPPGAPSRTMPAMSSP